MSITHRITNQFNKRWYSKQQIHDLFLLLVPALLLAFMIFRFIEFHFFYQGWYDPVYAYLMNGLTFALGSFDIGHIDHPGTPLQVFCAIIIKTVSFFRGIASGNLAEDVIRNPELYLRIISFSLVIINCVFLWLLGYFAYKKLDNRSMAVVIQLIPLLSVELVKYLPIVCCESVIILSSFALVACLIGYNDQLKDQKLLMVTIALLSALSVATKISSLPILIIPFFFFKGIKPKTSYTLLTLLFIVIFLLPITGKIGNFFSFIKGIATHSGTYGSGNKTLIDWGIFFHSLIQILTKDIVFTFYIIILASGWMVILKKRVKGSLYRLYSAITLATFLQIIMVSRHFGFHYLMPLFSLAMPLLGYFWLSLFREKILSWPTRTITLVVIVFVSVIFLRLIIRNNFNKGIVTPVEETALHINKEMKAPFIILTDGNNGGAFIDPALQFGLGYTGSTLRQTYRGLIDKFYHENYLWNPRDGYTNWQGCCLPAELYSKYRELYLYERNFNDEAPMSQMASMINQTGMAGFLTLRKVYENKLTHETIALAQVDTAKVRKLKMPILKIETGAEFLSSNKDKILSTDGKNCFSGVELLSGNHVHAGNRSVLLTPSSPYGLNIAVPIVEGKRFKAKIWQRSSDGNYALIVASSNIDGVFYRSSAPPNVKSGEWGECELTFSLPSNYPENEVNFYLWNPSKDSVWVDDFSISLFP